jgi:hypothetical protein
MLSFVDVQGVVAAGEAPSSVDKGPALKYWEKKLPGVAVPVPLREAVSPVEGSALADLFATHIQHGAFYPSTSASFCKMAGLVCDDETLHSGHHHHLDKPAYSYKGDKGAYSYKEDKDAYNYKRDKDAYNYKGEKDAYNYKGDKGTYNYKGEKDAYNYKGEKDAYNYQGEKDAYNYQGDKGAYNYKGDEGAYNYKGEKDAYNYKGDKGTYNYKGEKDAYNYQGEKGAYNYKGEKDAYNYMGEKGAYNYKGEKGAYNYKGEKDAYNYKADKTAWNYKFDESSTPSKGYFLETDVAVGAILRLKEQPPIPAKPFVPRVVADAMPAMTRESLLKLQRIFNIQEGTEMYDSLDFVTTICDNATSLEGEERICPTSLESFVDFLSSHVGPDVQVLTSSPRPRIVMGPMKITNFTLHHSVEDKLSVVICHILNFPSQMYMCHSVPDTKVVEATMTDAEGVEIQATGICHLDTKMWSPGHQSFRILGTQPGTPVCHWNAQEALVWYSTKTEATSVIHEAAAHGGHMAMDMKSGHDYMGM